MERGFRRGVVGDEFGRARPADFDAAEQVGLRARHAEQALRLEGGALAEDLLVRLEAHLGAAPVLDGAELLQLALRRAAAERHGVKLLAARHFHFQLLGQRVDHRHADAVQAAGGVVDLGVEFAARVQGGHDHFEGGLGLELGVRIDRNAPAVVGDGEKTAGLELHLDPGGVAGHRFVHGVVDHLGEQVMQRLLVGAADVHARPAPHRLEAFEHLDVGGGIAVRTLRLAYERRAPRVCLSLLAALPGPTRLQAPGRRRALGTSSAFGTSSRLACGFGGGASALARFELSDLPNRSRKAPRRKADMDVTRCWREVYPDATPHANSHALANPLEARAGLRWHGMAAVASVAHRQRALNASSGTLSSPMKNEPEAIVARTPGLAAARKLPARRHNRRKADQAKRRNRQANARQDRRADRESSRVAREHKRKQPNRR